MQVNPKARMVACAIRALCSIFHYNSKKPVDVEFVHGNLKYAIAPMYSDDARNDPIRDEYLSGSLNTQKRKVSY
jgi:hypothetical protein